MLGVERRLRDDLALVDAGPGDDELDDAAVERRLADVVEAGAELGEGGVLHAGELCRRSGPGANGLRRTVAPQVSQ